MMRVPRNLETVLQPFGERVVLSINGPIRLQMLVREDWVMVVSKGHWAISEVRIAADLMVDLIVFLLRGDGGQRGYKDVYIEFPARQVWYHNMATMDSVCGQLNIPASAYVNIESHRNWRVRNVVGNVDRFNPDVWYNEMNDDPSVKMVKW